MELADGNPQATDDMVQSSGPCDTLCTLHQTKRAADAFGTHVCCSGSRLCLIMALEKLDAGSVRVLWSRIKSFDSRDCVEGWRTRNWLVSQTHESEVLCQSSLPLVGVAGVRFSMTGRDYNAWQEETEMLCVALHYFAFLQAVLYGRRYSAMQLGAQTPASRRLVHC